MANEETQKTTSLVKSEWCAARDFSAILFSTTSCISGAASNISLLLSVTVPSISKSFSIKCELGFQIFLLNSSYLWTLTSVSSTVETFSLGDFFTFVPGLIFYMRHW